MGAEALQGALHRFDPKFLSGATRTALKEHPELLGRGPVPHRVGGPGS